MNIIYKITNLINEKIYVGSTTYSIDSRFKEHIYDAENRAKSYFHKAIKKYGKENFKIEELFRVFNEEDLNYFEDLFIDQFEALNPNIGYNLVYSDRKVGAGGHISKCMKLDWKNNRESRLESLRNMKDNSGWDNLNKFKPSKEEQSNMSKRTWESGRMDHISDVMKKEWANPEIKKKRINSMIKGSKKKAIIAVSIYGDDIKKFESINHAKREGFNGSSIMNSLKCRAAYGQGYVWHYAQGLDSYESIYAETLRVLGDWKQKDDSAIQAFDPKAGIKVIYPSLQAVKDAGFSIKAINRSLSGRRKIAQGFVWSYI